MSGGTDETRAFIETARRFAEKEIAPVIGTEGRDGDLARLGAVLARAEEAGILASARPEAPGGDWGVWGRECTAALSAAILEELARACAGVAACVHFAGLGAAELFGNAAGGKLLRSGDDGAAEVFGSPAAAVLLGGGGAGASTASGDAKPAPGRAAVAYFEPPGLLSLADPPKLRAERAVGGFTLTGEKVFVQAAPATEAYVVFAAAPEPAAFWVAAEAPGLSESSPLKKTGLAALETLDLKLDGVRVTEGAKLAGASPSAFLARNWIGLSAIALGNARGALAAAKKYAADRYQGGAPIAEHAAVKQLLAESESRIESSAAHLASIAERGVTEPLRSVAMAKLRVTVECAQAATDCLQVLGGYGYMEDYRLEKRLRDALTLKSMAGRPDDLRLLIAGSEALP